MWQARSAESGLHQAGGPASASSSSSSLLDISRPYLQQQREGGLRGFFGAFFRGTTTRRQRPRSSRRRRILYFGNSSSSSVNSDLAYGNGYITRPKSRSFSPRESTYSHHQRRRAHGDDQSYDSRQDSTRHEHHRHQQYSSHQENREYSSRQENQQHSSSHHENQQRSSHQDQQQQHPSQQKHQRYSSHHEQHTRHRRRAPSHAATDGSSRSVPKNDRTDEEIMEIGRQLSHLSRSHDRQEAGRSSRSSGIMATAAAAVRSTMLGDTRDTRRYESRDASRRATEKSRRRRAASSDESEWESASEDESSADDAPSELAYGPVVPPSTRLPEMSTALGSTVSRWSGTRRSGSVVDPRLFGPVNSLHGFVTPQPLSDESAAESSAQYHNFNRLRRVETAASPMKEVVPFPMSDAARFQGEGVASGQDSGRRGMRRDESSLPLRHPVPKAPVPAQVFEAEGLEHAQRRKTSGASTRRNDGAARGVGIVGAGMAAIGLGRRDGGEKTKEEVRKERGKDSSREERRDERRDERWDERRDERRREEPREEQRQEQRDDRRQERHIDERREDRRQERRRDEPRDNIRRDNGRDHPKEKQAKRDRQECREAGDSSNVRHDQKRDDGVDRRGKSDKNEKERKHSERNRDGRQTKDGGSTSSKSTDEGGSKHRSSVHGQETSSRVSRDLNVDDGNSRHSRLGIEVEVDAHEVDPAQQSQEAQQSRRSKDAHERQGKEEHKYSGAQDSNSQPVSQAAIIDPFQYMVHDDECDDGEATAPVTRPASKAAPPSVEKRQPETLTNPYAAPDADVRLDNKGFPRDTHMFKTADDKSRARDPSCERDRPMLNLVLPTPQSSRRATPSPEGFEGERVKGGDEASGDEMRHRETRHHESSDSDQHVYDAAPVTGPVDTAVLPPSTPKSVTWGENSTKSFEVESPEHKSDGEKGRDARRPRLHASSLWGILAQAISDSSAEPVNESGSKLVNEPETISTEPLAGHVGDAMPRTETSASGPKPVSPESGRMPGAFAPDIEFAATLAAGLEDSGFDPDLVINDANYHRRSSPPGEGESRGDDFNEQSRSTHDTVDSPRHTPLPESRQASRPESRPESMTHQGQVDVLQGEPSEKTSADDSWADVGLSKKERRRLERLKRQSGSAPEPMTESPPETVSAADGAEALQQLSKEEQRQLDREAILEDSAQSDDDDWRDLDGKGSKKSRRSGTGASSRASVSTDASSGWQSITKAETDEGRKAGKKQKKKVQSKRDSESHESSSRSGAASEVSIDSSSSKSKRRSGTKDDFADYGSLPPGRQRHLPEQSDATSVVSEPQPGGRRRDSRQEKASWRYDDDDSRSAASAPVSSRKGKEAEGKDAERKSSGLFSGIFKSGSSKDEPAAKQSFLGNADTFGAGVGLTGVSAPPVDSLDSSNAAQSVSCSLKHDDESGHEDDSQHQHQHQHKHQHPHPHQHPHQHQHQNGQQAMIDCQFDRVPLPPPPLPPLPSKTGGPWRDFPTELPSLPESPPSTPVRDIDSVVLAQRRRRSIQETSPRTPPRTPSSTTVPFSWRRSAWSTPVARTSADAKSPLSSPPGSAEAQTRRHSHRTSWDRSCEMQPLFLVEKHGRHDESDDSLVQRAGLSALPPSEPSSRESPSPPLRGQHDMGDALGLHIDTRLATAADDSHDDVAGSQETMPKARRPMEMELPPLPKDDESRYAVESMSKDRSSYLLESTPPSVRHLKHGGATSIDSTRALDGDGVQRELKKQDDLASADEHFSDAVEGQLEQASNDEAGDAGDDDDDVFTTRPLHRDAVDAEQVVLEDKMPEQAADSSLNREIDTKDAEASTGEAKTERSLLSTAAAAAVAAATAAAATAAQVVMGPPQQTVAEASQNKEATPAPAEETALSSELAPGTKDGASEESESPDTQASGSAASEVEKQGPNVAATASSRAVKKKNKEKERRKRKKKGGEKKTEAEKKKETGEKTRVDESPPPPPPPASAQSQIESASPMPSTSDDAALSRLVDTAMGLCDEDAGSASLVDTDGRAVLGMLAETDDSPCAAGRDIVPPESSLGSLDEASKASHDVAIHDGTREDVPEEIGTEEVPEEVGTEAVPEPLRKNSGFEEARQSGAGDVVDENLSRTADRGVETERAAVESETSGNATADAAATEPGLEVSADDTQLQYTDLETAQQLPADDESSSDVIKQGTVGERRVVAEQQPFYPSSPNLHVPLGFYEQRVVYSPSAWRLLPAAAAKSGPKNGVDLVGGELGDGFGQQGDDASRETTVRQDDDVRQDTIIQQGKDATEDSTVRQDNITSQVSTVQQGDDARQDTIQQGNDATKDTTVQPDNNTIQYIIQQSNDTNQVTTAGQNNKTIQETMVQQGDDTNQETTVGQDNKTSQDTSVQQEMGHAADQGDEEQGGKDATEKDYTEKDATIVAQEPNEAILVQEVFGLEQEPRTVACQPTEVTKATATSQAPEPPESPTAALPPCDDEAATCEADLEPMSDEAVTGETNLEPMSDKAAQQDSSRVTTDEQGREFDDAKQALDAAVRVELPESPSRPATPEATSVERGIDEKAELVASDGSKEVPDPTDSSTDLKEVAQPAASAALEDVAAPVASEGSKEVVEPTASSTDLKEAAQPVASEVLKEVAQPIASECSKEVIEPTASGPTAFSTDLKELTESVASPDLEDDAASIAFEGSKEVVEPTASEPTASSTDLKELTESVASEGLKEVAQPVASLDLKDDAAPIASADLGDVTAPTDFEDVAAPVASKGSKEVVKPTASNDLKEAAQPITSPDLEHVAAPAASDGLKEVVEPTASTDLKEAAQPVASADLEHVAAPAASDGLKEVVEPTASTHLKEAAQPVTSPDLEHVAAPTASTGSKEDFKPTAYTGLKEVAQDVVSPSLKDVAAPEDAHDTESPPQQAEPRQEATSEGPISSIAQPYDETAASNVASESGSNLAESSPAAAGKDAQGKDAQKKHVQDKDAQEKEAQGKEAQADEVISSTPGKINQGTAATATSTSTTTELSGLTDAPPAQPLDTTATNSDDEWTDLAPLLSGPSFSNATETGPPIELDVAAAKPSTESANWTTPDSAPTLLNLDDEKFSGQVGNEVAQAAPREAAVSQQGDDVGWSERETKVTPRQLEAQIEDKSELAAETGHLREMDTRQDLEPPPMEHRHDEQLREAESQNPQAAASEQDGEKEAKTAKAEEGIVPDAPPEQDEVEDDDVAVQTPLPDSESEQEEAVARPNRQRHTLAAAPLATQEEARRGLRQVASFVDSPLYDSPDAVDHDGWLAPAAGSEAATQQRQQQDEMAATLSRKLARVAHEEDAAGSTPTPPSTDKTEAGSVRGASFVTRFPARKRPTAAPTSRVTADNFWSMLSRSTFRRSDTRKSTLKEDVVHTIETHIVETDTVEAHATEIEGTAPREVEQDVKSKGMSTREVKTAHEVDSGQSHPAKRDDDGVDKTAIVSEVAGEVAGEQPQDDGLAETTKTPALDVDAPVQLYDSLVQREDSVGDVNPNAPDVKESGASSEVVSEQGMSRSAKKRAKKKKKQQQQSIIKASSQAATPDLSSSKEPSRLEEHVVAGAGAGAAIPTRGEEEKKNIQEDEDTKEEEAKDGEPEIQEKDTKEKDEEEAETENKEDAKEEDAEATDEPMVPHVDSVGLVQDATKPVPDESSTLDGAVGGGAPLSLPDEAMDDDVEAEKVVATDEDHTEDVPSEKDDAEANQDTAMDRGVPAYERDVVAWNDDNTGAKEIVLAEDAKTDSKEIVVGGEDDDAPVPKGDIAGKDDGEAGNGIIVGKDDSVVAGKDTIMGKDDDDEAVRGIVMDKDDGVEAKEIVSGRDDHVEAASKDITTDKDGDAETKKSTVTDEGIDAQAEAVMVQYGDAEANKDSVVDKGVGAEAKDVTLQHVDAESSENTIMVQVVGIDTQDVITDKGIDGEASMDTVMGKEADDMNRHEGEDAVAEKTDEAESCNDDAMGTTDEAEASKDAVMGADDDHDHTLTADPVHDSVAASRDVAPLAEEVTSGTEREGKGKEIADRQEEAILHEKETLREEAHDSLQPERATEPEAPPENEESEVTGTGEEEWEQAITDQDVAKSEEPCPQEPCPREPCDRTDQEEATVEAESSTGDQDALEPSLLQKGPEIPEPVGGLLEEEEDGDDTMPVGTLPAVQEVSEGDEYEGKDGDAKIEEAQDEGEDNDAQDDEVQDDEAREDEDKKEAKHDDVDTADAAAAATAQHPMPVPLSRQATPVLQWPRDTPPRTPEPVKRSNTKSYGELTLGSDDAMMAAATALAASRLQDSRSGSEVGEGKGPALRRRAASTSTAGPAPAPASTPGGSVPHRSVSISSLARGASPAPVAPTPVTPTLRRVDKRMSGDLRALRQQSSTSTLSSNNDQAQQHLHQQQPHHQQQHHCYHPNASASSLASAEAPSTPIANEGRPRKDAAAGDAKEMADVYDGYGQGRIGSPRSPTRPHSMRRRQSMQVLELESRVEQLLAENRQLSDARAAAETSSTQRAAALGERNAEIDSLKASLLFINNEVARLREINDGLTSANAELASRDNSSRYGHVQVSHESLSQTLTEKDAEIAQLRGELDAAKTQMQAMQRRILDSKAADADFLALHDDDYFENRCQMLFSHVQQWVLRFSKFSDMRPCRLTGQISDDKTVERLDNAVLDGSDVDIYLNDRVRRRDVFMSVTMHMIWEFVFTRYLFGMDREQRQKLKSLEKMLADVGPVHAVRQWRAVTLTLLSRRDSFKAQRELDTEAVVQAILHTLASMLPPPTNLEGQVLAQLRRVVSEAVDLSVEMRLQRAEYIMLPPLQPEYTPSGNLASTVLFDASMMNERGADMAQTSNRDLEARGALVRVVLFPLVIKKGDDDGLGDDKIVVCPAQVLTAVDAKTPKPPVAAQPSSEAGGASLAFPSGISVVTETMSHPEVA